MLPLIIKMQTGYSIDYKYPGEERCPNCGGRVYHINEDDYIVFCTSPLCSWRDRTHYPKGVSYYEIQKRNIRESFEQALLPGNCIHLLSNSKYPYCKHPVIIMGDACDYRYIIRDFDFNAGYDFFDGGYNEETRPIVQYSTLDELINDGWRLD